LAEFGLYPPQENEAAPRRTPEVTLEDLLRHRAGLGPWLPLYELGIVWDSSLASRLSAAQPARARRGTYSDLGFIIWARLAEQALGSSLLNLLSHWVLEPLGLEDQIQGAETARPEHVHRCNMSTDQEVRLAAAQGLVISDQGPPSRGQPQDGNARWLGRYCGHAGLFGSVEGVWALGEAWRCALAGDPVFLQPRAALHALAGRGTRRLGWWMRTLRGAAGTALSRHAFGHTGFTGGSLWVDPDRDIVVCLLAHRASSQTDLQPLRRSVHRAVCREAGSC
jgi:CubicO group peptidase (beta-lactamase class C family)